MKKIGHVATAVGAASARRASSANDRITLAILGLGNRGTSHVRSLSRNDGVEIAHICDVDAARFERSLGLLDSAGRPEPGTHQDFRKALDDPAVDAVVIAANHHWQALMAILACQAGKDVYVEKPGSHDLNEARQLVAAARKHERIVQLGVQNRSAPYLQEARELVLSGAIGTLHLVRVLSMNEGRVRAKGAEATPPATLDWDMWCGPAALQPYAPGSWHINRFDFGVGRIVDDLVHQADLARYITGLGAPLSATSVGSISHFDDGREWPDTQVTTYDYPDLTLLCQSTLWVDAVRETPSVIRDGDTYPNWLMNGTKIELFGTEGMMLVGRQGGGWQVYDNDRKLVKSSYGRPARNLHMDDFLDCVRSRKSPIGDIADTWKSMALCHLGSASYRLGNRTLAFDPETGRIKDDSEANAIMHRKGRSPWEIPDVA